MSLFFLLHSGTLGCNLVIFMILIIHLKNLEKLLHFYANDNCIVPAKLWRIFSWNFNFETLPVSLDYPMFNEMGQFFDTLPFL